MAEVHVIDKLLCSAGHPVHPAIPFTSLNYSAAGKRNISSSGTHYYSLNMLTDYSTRMQETDRRFVPPMNLLRQLRSRSGGRLDCHLPQKRNPTPGNVIVVHSEVN